MATDTLRVDSARVTPAPGAEPAFANAHERDLHAARCNFEDLACKLDGVQAIAGLLGLAVETQDEMGAALRGLGRILAEARDWSDDRAEYYGKLSNEAAGRGGARG